MSLPLIAVIGAGPAGLTAAYELQRSGKAQVLLLEKTCHLGGIARTENYKGNRIDMGGHRFFSKSDEVLDWWFQFMPLEHQNTPGFTLQYQGHLKTVSPAAPQSHSGSFMQIRRRQSRILHRNKLFDYPLSLNFKTIHQLGFWNMVLIGISYIHAQLKPIKPELTLKSYIINHFGRHLFQTFFESYTEKVWGINAAEIPADWGRQRIKGLSLGKAVSNAFKKIIGIHDKSIKQKQTPTSLIEYFLYPPHGPGELWETVYKKCLSIGCDVRMNTELVKIEIHDQKIESITVRIDEDKEQTIKIDAVFSSMPIRNLISSISPPPPDDVRKIADGLLYRDFLTVGVLLNGITIEGKFIQAFDLANKLPDTWIYVQESEIKMGRIQVFNNWSPALVADPNTIWLGLEYFFSDKDALHSASDEAVIEMAKNELKKLGWASDKNILDAVVIRTPKAYPAYFGSYQHFSHIQSYLNSIENLFPMGRNGMHRYNNMDHSMLTAMLSIDAWNKKVPKENVWHVMSDDSYLEEKTA